MNALNPKFRSVLVLRYFNEASTEEISQILKIPLGTVLSRIKRGQEKLKRILAQQGAVTYG